ncbi:MAG: fibronectin type III domain-containing protein [Bacteroidetes bacterium]|nr:MAG: fibronectin type III domain-containing protein [Bacteroidota bacterium]
MKSVRILFIASILLVANTLFAQNYPVQTTIQLTPPYTSYLPDYTDGVNSKLQVALNIADVNESFLQVKLNVSLEGPGGKIFTNPNFIQTPISLNFGQPLILSGLDLAPYLAAENLIFPSEQFKQNYLQTKVLPEGLWKLCVEVLDASNPSAEPLSSNNCALIFVARLQAPMLNLPVCETTIPRAQSIFFTWTDMALGSYVVGNEPEYEFSLYSVPLSAYDNPTQVLNTNPIYQEITTLTSLSLDTSQILIPAGQKYLWQVRAKLPDGSGAYLNNGYSAPCTFIFGDLAQEVLDDLSIHLSAVAEGPTHGFASWTVSSASGANLTFDSYIIAYRKAGGDYFWYEETVVGLNKDILQLEENTTYEVKIKGLTNGLESAYTDVVTFTTTPYPNYACGDGNQTPLPPNFTPLPVYDANPGIEVQQGQFLVDVTSIESNGMGEGHYKGTGTVRVNFLLISLNVSFDDLLIDNQYIARQGTVNVIAQDLDDWIKDGYLENGDIEYVDGTLTDGVFVNDSTITVTTTDGTYTFTFDGDTPIVVRDEDNNEWQFWPDGTIVKTNYGITESEDNLDVSKDEFMYFVHSSNQSYPTDVKEYAHFSENYEAIQGSGGFLYFVANKSMSRSNGDKIKAYLHSSNLAGIDQSQISFGIAGASDTLGFTHTDSTYLLNAPNRNGNYSIYAFYQGNKIGKLNVFCLPQKDILVNIVPLVNLTYSQADIENELNTLFRGAQLNFNVTIASNYSSSNFTSSTTFADPDANVLASYTQEMRDLRDEYLENNTIDPKSYLVFLIPGFTDASIDGYMVRGRGLGFVTSSTLSSLSNFGRTLGHELGHGIGALQHSWKDNVDFKATTNNLMDYNNGSKLIADQWLSLQNPPTVLSFLDDEEDGANVVVETAGIQDILKFQNVDKLTFVDPAGRPYSLPNTVTKLRFASPDNRWVRDGEVTDVNISPIGSLVGFEVNGITYNGRMGSSSGNFLGYKDDAEQAYSPVEPTTYNYILAGLPVLKNGNIRFKICPLNVAAVTAHSNTVVGGSDVPVTDKFKLLTNFMDANSESQGEEILAEYTGQITQKELQVLSYYKNTAFGREAVFAMEILHLLRGNPIVGGCISDIFSETASLIEEEDRNQVAIEQQNAFSDIQVASTTYIAPAYDPIFTMQELSINPEFFPNSGVTDNERFFEKFYYALAGWVAATNTVKDYYTYNVAGEENIDIGAYADYIYDKLSIDQRSCYLGKLSVNQRIQILNEYSEWTFGDEKERLILEVIENTPKEQYGQMLAEFKKNAFKLMRGLNGDLWNSQNHALFHKVSWMLIDYKDAKITYQRPTVIYAEGSSSGEPPMVTLQKYYHDGYKVETSATWSSYDGEIRFRIKGYENGQQLFSSYFDVDPYEIIIVRITDDYQFAAIDGTQAVSGDEFAVPAMYAYWMIQEQDKIESLVAVRVILNAVGIVASVATLNPGPYLTATVAFNAIDIAFALTEGYINDNGSLLQKQVWNGWNTFAGIVGIIEGGVLVKNVAQGLAKFTFNKSKFQNFVNNNRWNKATLLKVRDQLANLFKTNKSSSYNSGYDIVQDQLELALRQNEIGLMKGAQQEVNLVLSNTSSDVLKVGYDLNGNMTYYQVGFMEIGSDGKVILDQLNFTEDIANVDRLILNCDNINYRNAASELKNAQDVTIVRMADGSTKVMSRALANIRAQIDELISLVSNSTTKATLEADLLASNQLRKAMNSNNKLVSAWEAVYDLPVVLRRDVDFLGGVSDLVEYNLFQNIGSASKGEVSNIHRYTINGDYLNSPMRGPYTESPLSIPAVTLDDYAYQSYLSIKNGLNKLRQTSRLETGVVNRGRTLSQADYDLLFGSGSPQDIPLKGFQSATLDIEVAKAFTALTDFPGQKVRVIMRIKSNNGVLIDDFSDWGATLGPINHADADPVIRVQQEVLLEEGYYRKLGAPQQYLENGIPKVDPDGTVWMTIDLEELGTPLRQISN